MFLFMETPDRMSAVELEQTALDFFQENPLLCNFGRNARSPNKGSIKSKELLEKMRLVGKLRYNNDPSLREKLANASRKNWKNNRESMMKVVSTSLAMGALTTSQSVSIDEVIYSSVSEAGRTLGLCHTGVLYRIKSNNYPTWFKIMKTDKKEQPVIDGIILFSDGSCVPNPGSGGWGIHGYTYSLTPPTTGSGNSDFYVTDRGYVNKFMLDTHRKGTWPDDEGPFSKLEGMELKDGTYDILNDHMLAKEVTPLSYIDFFGPLGESTNNAAETTALLEALRYCLKEGIKKVQIMADSMYTLDGWNKILPMWANNRWTRRDGMPIKNKEIWQALWALKDQVKDFSISATWLPGHSIFLGNQMADMNANLGKNMTLADMSESMFNISPAKGYWKAADVDKHPLIAHQKLFFNGEYEHHQPGVYFMGGVDNDLGLLGKRLSDAAYSVVRTKEPIKSIEELVRYHCKQGEDMNQLVIAYLSTFYKTTVYNQFMEYGNFSLYHADRWSNDLMSSDRRQPVTVVIDPPKRSPEAVLAMNNVASWLNAYLDKSSDADRFTLTDITGHLYEPTVITKKGKDVEVMRLKASIQPGVASIEVDANCKDSGGNVIVLPIILSFGIDTADRNGFKRIEDLNPKVSLLTWEESSGVFRYFTIIEAGEDAGAYCGYYSNVRLNKAKKKAV